MSIFIIPRSGTYYGHFEFAVVKSGRQRSKLKVTVADEQHTRPVYVTKGTWPSGNRLALPPGNYRVRVELLLPRLDGSSLLLDALERNYYVVKQRDIGPASATPLLVRPLREEFALRDGHAQHLGTLLTAATPFSADQVNGCEVATPFVSFAPSHRSTPNHDDRSYSLPNFLERDIAAEGECGKHIDAAVEVNRGSSLNNNSSNSAEQADVHARDPASAEVLLAFSQRLSRRATPFSMPIYSHLDSDTAAQLSHPHFAREPMRAPSHEYQQSGETGGGTKAALPRNGVTSNFTPSSAMPCIWELPPTPERGAGLNAEVSSLDQASEVLTEGQQDRDNAPMHVLYSRSVEPSRDVLRPQTLRAFSVRSSEAGMPGQLPRDDFVECSAEGISVESCHNYSTQSTRASGSLRLPYGAAMPFLNEAVGICSLNGRHPESPACLSTPLAKPSSNLTAGGSCDINTPASSWGPMPAVLHRDPTPAEAPEVFSTPRERLPSKGEYSNNSALPTSMLSSTIEKEEEASPMSVAGSNHWRSFDRSSTQLTSPRLSSCKYGPMFVVPPPDVIDVHIPFSFALAFGVPNARPVSKSIFLNVLVEEEAETGVKPPEPMICVVPSALAEVPTIAKGISSAWVCSPSIRADERRGVIELLGGAVGQPRNGMIISTVCVGPSWNGLTLSGIQFVLDTFDEGANAWQFFVSFREIESIDDEVENENGDGTLGEDGESSAIIHEKNMHMSNVDERALGAEVLYNSLPYIRCFKNENGAVMLEVHRKSAVVACDPVQKNSRIAMYFGTATTKTGVEQQPYISVLVDYRTVFFSSVRDEKIPEVLHTIMMSSVESMHKTGRVAFVRLREVEFLSQQHRLVAFADEVILNNEKASRFESSGRQKQTCGDGRQGTLAAWVAGENPGLQARRRVAFH